MCGDISEGAVGTVFGKDGKAGLNPSADLKNPQVVENIKLAAETCPMLAITVEED